jgi:hypothetical protein
VRVATLIETQDQPRMLSGQGCIEESSVHAEEFRSGIAWFKRFVHLVLAEKYSIVRRLKFFIVM